MGAGSSNGLPAGHEPRTWGAIEPPPVAMPGGHASDALRAIQMLQSSRAGASATVSSGLKSSSEDAEMSHTIAHLAAANQQLATAHNLTLGHLAWLVAEFGKSAVSSQPSPADLIPRAKRPCSHCRHKDGDVRSTGKRRASLGKQSIAIRTPSRKLWRLRKLPAFDESGDVEEHKENSRAREIEDELRKEIEDLNVFKTESQTTNDRLMSDLEEQRLVIQRLTQDFEDSRQECELKESRLAQVSGELSRSERETARLLAELETFQSTKDATEKLEREEATLRARLAERDATLDEANQQIRALELAVEASAQNHKPDSELVTETSEPLADSQTSMSALSSTANEEFKKDLMIKREARQRAIAAISAEMERLRRELEEERTAHAETTRLLENLREAHAKSIAELKTDEGRSDNKTDVEAFDRLEARRLFDLLKISDKVTSDLWLQLERTDDLRFQLENEADEHRLRIGSLKRLAEETRSSLRERKNQMNGLKDRLAQLLVRLGDRRFLEAPDDMREEAERQVEDIARTRSLGDERARILAELKDQFSKEAHELRVKLDSARKDNLCLEEDLRKTEDKMDTQDAEVLNLESQLGLAKADCRDLQNQMSVINSLFTQMLLGASSAEMDLDRLTRLLQENHDLISDMAKENCTEAAALPKLLLDIIEQVDGGVREGQEKKGEDDLQEENIALNLPKVWRVLLELLSCHAAGTSGSGSSSTTIAESAPDSCYKSVDTPTGPRLVISVSKTYIRLKELILEKKHLEKEMNRMKQLNTHLESKLSEQEKRLSTVSDELSKTWNIVGRMQAQHQQLHTHEKILRYELQQKRKMLQELKQELEYCREKWESARQKNTNTEIEWRSLRREFAARKALANHTDSFNNSGESGFSDEREEESDDDEDEGEVGKRVRPLNSRRRPRKDESRAITPDTESEQPTDTEFSESKTASPSTSGQRTPTPETEAEENPEVVEQDPLPTTPVPDDSRNSTDEDLDPLDKALTNVIQNLIKTDESKYAEVPSCEDNVTVNSTFQKVANETILEEESVKDEQSTDISNENLNKSRMNVNEDIVKTNSETVSTISVFTIGPVPSQTLAVKNVQFSNPLVVGPSNKVLENISDSKTNESILSINIKEKELPKACDTDSSLELEAAGTSSTNQNDKGSSSTSIKTEEPTKTREGSEEIQTRISEFPSAEVLDARAARLKSLEEQAEWLVKKVNDTNRRGSALNSRLAELHETYGSTPEAPPMPDILPAFRLRTEANEVGDSNDTPTQHTQDSDEEKR